MTVMWLARLLGFLLPVSAAGISCLVRHPRRMRRVLAFFGMGARWSGLAEAVPELTSPASWRGLLPTCWFLLLWAVGTSWLWTDFFKALLSFRPPGAALWGGVAGALFLLVVENAWATWIRFRVATEVVDLFEMDEAFLPLLKHLDIVDEVEPSHAAYQAALASTYEYVGTLTYGKNPHLWMFSFFPHFMGKKQARGWHIPQYPWLQHIGGPALLNVDSEILLVTERLVAPWPQPIHPGEQHEWFLSWRDPRVWLHQYDLDGLSVGWREMESEKGGCLFFLGRLLPMLPTPVYYRVNAALSKFGRVRYPVLFGLRAQTITRDHVLVRTQEGLPLRVPNIRVTFDLYHQGHVIREARSYLPRAEWQRLAWGATLRLMGREANHWKIRSATDLAAYVMGGALEGAFRKVFADHTATRLLDRVHREELQRILNSWPEDARRRMEDELNDYLKDLEPLSWQDIHDELLKALNGPKEEGYPEAEKRGLLVTQISFGDWNLPARVRQAHREAMHILLAWEGEQRRSVRYQHRTRFSQTEAQHLADLMASELPSAEVHLASLAPLAQAEEFITWTRRGWIQVLNHLLEGVRFHERVRDLFTGEFGFELSVEFDPALLDAEDPRIRDRNLVAWLLNVVGVLSIHPWGYADPFSGRPPDDFLGS